MHDVVIFGHINMSTLNQQNVDYILELLCTPRKLIAHTLGTPKIYFKINKLFENKFPDDTLPKNKVQWSRYI